MPGTVLRPSYVLSYLALTIPLASPIYKGETADRRHSATSTVGRVTGIAGSFCAGASLFLSTPYKPSTTVHEANSNKAFSSAIHGSFFWKHFIITVIAPVEGFVNQEAHNTLGAGRCPCHLQSSGGKAGRAVA